MTTALIALSLTAAILAGLLAAGALYARRRIAAANARAAQLTAARDADGYAALRGQQVTASVVDGGSIRGVLTHVYANALVLAHPEYIGVARPTGLGAEVTIARARVPMLQRFEHEPADG